MHAYLWSAADPRQVGLPSFIVLSESIFSLGGSNLMKSRYVSRCRSAVCTQKKEQSSWCIISYIYQDAFSQPAKPWHKHKVFNEAVAMYVWQSNTVQPAASQFVIIWPFVWLQLCPFLVAELNSVLFSAVVVEKWAPASPRWISVWLSLNEAESWDWSTSALRFKKSQLDSRW